MKLVKTLLYIIMALNFSTSFSIAQTQIGDNILGGPLWNSGYSVDINSDGTRMIIGSPGEQVPPAGTPQMLGAIAMYEYVDYGSGPSWISLGLPAAIENLDIYFRRFGASVSMN